VASVTQFTAIIRWRLNHWRHNALLLKRLTQFLVRARKLGVFGHAKG
jgi:hypothetical protein